MVPERVTEILNILRKYWDIEGLLHQSLDVTAREDGSRVKNRNSLLILGIARRSVIGIKENWKQSRKNKRQSTMLDFYDAMSKNNHQQAFGLFRRAF
jgi:hypothetical protein